MCCADYFPCAGFLCQTWKTPEFHMPEVPVVFHSLCASFVVSIDNSSSLQVPVLCVGWPLPHPRGPVGAEAAGNACQDSLFCTSLTPPGPLLTCLWRERSPYSLTLSYICLCTFLSVCMRRRVCHASWLIVPCSERVIRHCFVTPLLKGLVFGSWSI